GRHRVVGLRAVLRGLDGLLVVGCDVVRRVLDHSVYARHCFSLSCRRCRSCPLASFRGTTRRCPRSATSSPSLPLPRRAWPAGTTTLPASRRRTSRRDSRRP